VTTPKITIPVTLRRISQLDRSGRLRSIDPAIRGSAVGSFFGTLSGPDQTVASFFGYALEKRISLREDKFGTGQIECVVVPEFANYPAA